jgi:hypothetical protein
MIYNGSPIIDIGKFGAIGRFWSGETLHCQRLFQSFKDYFLLHLPGDKDYISNIPSVENLYEKYAEYLERKGIVISPKMHDLKNNSRFRNLLISMGLIKSFSD